MSTAEKQVTLQQELEVLKPEVQKVLPAHVTPDKFMRTVMTSIAQSPDLRTADRRTLLTACVKAATDGLMPDGREAALVIFKDHKSGKQLVQYMPMVAGILKKVRNSGELKSIMSNVVYEQDQFRYWVDDSGEHVLHEPNVLAEDRGKFLAVYAIAETKDGGIYVEVMSRGQVEQVKSVSRAKNGPWRDWYDEMARKTVVRRLSKRLPMSTDLLGVISADDSLYDLKGGGGQNVEAAGGVAGAKAALGLPTLPDVDPDPDDEDNVAAQGGESAADDPPADVNTDTGEVIEFDLAAACKQLEAKRTLKTLDEQYDAILTEQRQARQDTGWMPPDEFGIKYQEMRESLQEREKV